MLLENGKSICIGARWAYDFVLSEWPLPSRPEFQNFWRGCWIRDFRVNLSREQEMSSYTWPSHNEWERNRRTVAAHLKTSWSLLSLEKADRTIRSGSCKYWNFRGNFPSESDLLLFSTSVFASLVIGQITPGTLEVISFNIIYLKSYLQYSTLFLFTSSTKY